MTLSSLLASALLAATTALAQNEYARVPLDEPLNWVAGPSLFPVNVIAGYNAELAAYDRESWANHVLEQCSTFSDCTSTISFSAINSGTPKTRFWFGYVFRGGPTTQANYERRAGVLGSVAYSIVE
ncbi:hypothetical protein JDV02_009121 [Purpureocillium takamizusanense]|uniref:Uncharacterized protein n=1 Tax=Purpureocillium takamizusanense TaxID=2060973 RepID=A0A9Q8QQ74_9HYPO|nr:uncharacterized protein JDV02_009121 [Purpureocillium takamizusanense]UNI23291.1 hypothetical protein JDV02_009121 [Purpureocillium takamizusanense]